MHAKILFESKRMSSRASKQTERNSKHHHAFAHYALRQFAFGDPFRIFSLLVHGESIGYAPAEMFDGILKDLDSHIKEGKRRSFTGSDIAVTRCTIQGRVGVIVQMPPARNPTEACFIAMVSQYTPDQLEAGSWDEGTLDYYTFERPFKTEPNYCTVFCAWTEEGRHQNFGLGPRPNLDEVVSFLERGPLLA